MRHLVDADAASNTLSWRWVAGLQTKGKIYLATAHNISRYTESRFEPKGLATRAEALREAPVARVRKLDHAPAVPKAPALLLVTDEDLSPEWMGRGFATAIVAGGVDVGQRGVRGAAAAAFAQGALDDAASRLRESGLEVERTGDLSAEPIIAAAAKVGVDVVMTAHAPIGFTATAIDALEKDLVAAGLTLVRPRRSWDSAFWPHATRGFSQLRNAIPQALVSEALLP